MQQAGGAVDVAGQERPGRQRLGAAGGELGHGESVVAARGVVGDEDERLARAGQHGAELVAVGDAVVDVGGQEHRHDVVDVAEGVGYADALGDIRHGRRPALTAAMVEDAQAVRAGAVVGARAVEHHGRRAVAVVDGETARHSLEGPLDQRGGDAHDALGVDGAVGTAQQLDGPRQSESHAGALKNGDGRLVESLTLL